MSTELKFILALAGLIFFGSLTLTYAQTGSVTGQASVKGEGNFPPPPPPDGFRGPGGPGGRRGGDPFEKLDLTTQQREQIGAIRLASREAGSEFETKMRAADEQIRLMIDGGSFDIEKARPLVRAKSEAMSNIELIRLSGEAEIQKLLTPEQKAQLAQAKERRPPFPPGGGFAPPPAQ